MASLWRNENEDQLGSRAGDSSMHQPDERTRLLVPNQRHPPHRDEYLDPDDPAVSPYNLWTVQFLRYLTVLFLAISFIWWAILLTSIFVSPPGMHARGSGFFDFAYTSLTGGILLVALLFFSAPSKAMRISSATIALILLVDVILILTVERIRWEEGWVGIVSVIWAFLMAVWTMITDKVVAWGKSEEEERLTGRAETRRTVKEWLSVLIDNIILAIFIAISVLITGTLILRALDSTLNMNGQKYKVDGSKYEVHFACVGNVTYSKPGKRSPTILLESGEHPLEYDFEHWVYSSWTNGTIGRYCYWDRPGYAWSDNAPSPHSAGMSATALSEVLALAGEEGPWILVSAGYGSIVSRIFASMHRLDVVGLLLVDPLHENLLYRIGGAKQGFVTWGWGLISPLGLGLIPGAMFRGRTREDRVYGVSAGQGGRLLKARLQENLVAESLTKNEVSSARTIQDRKTALAVVSSGIKAKTDQEWEQKQEDLTGITDNLVSWTIVKMAPHQVWRTYEGRNALEKALGKLVKGVNVSQAGQGRVNPMTGKYNLGGNLIALPD